MTIGGWIFMLTSVTFVVSLALWCFSKVLKSAPESHEDLEAPKDPENPKTPQKP